MKYIIARTKKGMIVAIPIAVTVRLRKGDSVVEVSLSNKLPKEFK